jgi:hypothetical protein
VMFDAGDGKDTVYAGLDTTIRLGEGLSAKDMKIDIADRVATLSFGDGSDQIKIHINFQSPVTLAFADGTTTEIGAPRIPMVDLRGLQPPGGLMALKV